MAGTRPSRAQTRLQAPCAAMTVDGQAGLRGNTARTRTAAAACATTGQAGSIGRNASACRDAGTGRRGGEALMEREGEESRQAAGRALAAPLQPYAGPDVLIVGVSRGGILVGLEGARALGAPFEPLAIETLSDPVQPEHTAGVLVEPDYVALTAGTDEPAPLAERLRSVVAQGLEDVRRRGALYRG